MSLVNSLVIGNADSAIVVGGLEQTLISGIAQNKKRLTDLKPFENHWGDRCITHHAHRLMVALLRRRKQPSFWRIRISKHMAPSESQGTPREIWLSETAPTDTSPL